MDFFNNLINLKENELLKIENTVIEIFNDIELLANKLYTSYNSEKQQCFISKKEKCDLSGIIINIDNKITVIKWEYFFKINEYLNKKIKFNFKINNNFFNIFFIKFYFTNIDLIDNNAKYNLCGYKNAIFGIYNTYIDKVENTIFNLYFSYGLGIFIFEKVKDKKYMIIGKLFPWIKYDKSIHSLIINEIAIDCPKSFYFLKSEWFGINKRNKNKIKIPRINYDNLTYPIKYIYSSELDGLNLTIKLPFKLTKIILKELVMYILVAIPELKNKNLIFSNPSAIKFTDDFGLFINNEYLQIYISKKISELTEIILKTIYHFFSNQKIPKFDSVKDHKFQIHLFTELTYIFSYIISYILIKIYGTGRSLYDKYYKNDWIQSDIIFEYHEINALYKSKPEGFISNIEYVIGIIIKTISLKIYNKYVILNHNNNQSFIPLYKNLDNDTLFEILDRNNKSIFGKKIINKITESILKFSDNSKLDETPFIIINSYKVCYFNFEKITNIIENKNIPIKINIFYDEINNNLLHINISCNQKYRYIIDLLLECFNLLVKPELKGLDSISMISTFEN